jgi:hypothetical protein
MGSAARSRIDASSFSGLFTRVEIGHVVIGSAGNVKSRSCGSSLISIMGCGQSQARTALTAKSPAIQNKEGVT